MGSFCAPISMDDAYQASRTCAIDVPARVADALDGELEALASCHKLAAFVAATPELDANPNAVNGASILIVERSETRVGTRAPLSACTARRSARLSKSKRRSWWRRRRKTGKACRPLQKALA